ncbi:MAG TPA: pseudouridine synthase [Burkholderiales bacterium]|nr:pseudouridine synthase [Burkholderiales bacterium]
MLPILHQDDHLVAIDKPAGLLTHRTDLDRHEWRFALQLLRDQIGREVHPVHRLDRGVSGVLLFALDRDTTRAMTALFETREVEKSYLAVVRGWPSEQGEVDHPLVLRPDPYEWRGESADASAQTALTRYRRLATVELPHAVDPFPTSRYALVHLEPLTGRRHQLRRHLKHLAHPIIGDTRYGKGPHNRLFRDLLGCERLLLACVELRLRHPVTGEALSIMAPLRGEFAALIRRLGWRDAIPSRWIASD